jgi:hypothetical protein
VLEGCSSQKGQLASDVLRRVPRHAPNPWLERARCPFWESHPCWRTLYQGAVRSVARWRPEIRAMKRDDCSSFERRICALRMQIVLQWLVLLLLWTCKPLASQQPALVGAPAGSTVKALFRVIDARGREILHVGLTGAHRPPEPTLTLTDPEAPQGRFNTLVELKGYPGGGGHLFIYKTPRDGSRESVLTALGTLGRGTVGGSGGAGERTARSGYLELRDVIENAVTRLPPK